MSRARHRRQRSRGAAIVEAAIVAPVFFILTFGIIEMGFLYRDYLTATSAVTEAARIGGIVGPDTIAKPTSSPVNADFEIIKALREGMSSLDAGDIDTIVVFRSSGTGSGSAKDQVPALCKAGIPVANLCNVYDPIAAFFAVQESDAAFFDCSVTPTSPACTWDPTLRDDGPNPADIDYVGVYLVIDRPALTGMFTERYIISDASIVRLEPGEVG